MAQATLLNYLELVVIIDSKTTQRGRGLVVHVRIRRVAQRDAWLKTTFFHYVRMISLIRSEIGQSICDIVLRENVWRGGQGEEGVQRLLSKMAGWLPMVEARLASASVAYLLASVSAFMSPTSAISGRTAPSCTILT